MPYDTSPKPARIIGIAASLAALLAFTGRAQAQTADDGFVDANSIDGVASVRQRPDGSVELTLENGESVIVPSSAVRITDGVIMVDPASAQIPAAANAAGGIPNAALIGGGVLAAIGLAVAAADDDDDDAAAPAPAPAPENAAPSFTSGTDAAVIENEAGTGFVAEAEDADGDALSFSISGGADAELFQIDEATGELSFVEAPDFEAPGDAGADNLYEVEISVTDGTATVSQTVQVTVADQSEIAGTDGADDITGTDAADRIDAGAGDDVIEGAGGADIITTGAGADTIVFQGDPFDGEDVSAEGRQIVGGEDFVTDFDFASDTYRINAADFGIEGPVVFAALDANTDGATLPEGANVIVLLNADNDGDAETPFLAGTAAAQIAELTETDGAGVFVYWNSNLGVNRLVYSTNLNDPSADLKILSRQTDLAGQDAIDALANFSADNFEFVDVPEALPTIFEIAAEGAGFEILEAALVATGLDAVVNDPAADFTVFAPTDPAFIRLAQDLGIETDGLSDTDVAGELIAALTALAGGEEEGLALLSNVLLYHVSPGAQDLASLQAAGTITTALEGATFDVNGDTLEDNDRTITDPVFVDGLTDIAASNGVVQVINRVLLPIDVAGDDPTDDVVALTEVVDGTVLDGGAETAEPADDAGDIATGDTLDLSALTEAVAVDLDSSNQGALNPVPETQVGTLTQGDATVTLNDFENLIGTNGNDVLFGNNESNVILGGAGDDNIHPFGGVDFVDGGEGSDTLNLSAATGVTVDLETNTAGPNTFENFENVLGSVNGDDTLLGDDGANTLNGRGQDDVIDGRGGADTLLGDAGSDTFQLTTLDDGETIDGGADTDTLDLSGLTLTDEVETVIDLSTALTVTAAAATSPVSFNETTDGDISDDRANPTTLELGLGENTLVAEQQGDPSDIDYVTLIVPEGQVLSEIVLSDYDAEAGNLAFIGLQEGAAFTVDPAAPNVGDLLGGLTYGAGNVGENILDDMAGLGGAQGFTPPLPAGTYTIWLNQTGPASTASLSFVTAEAEDGGVDPATVALAGIENVIGTERAETIIATDEANRIEAAGGSDTVTTGAGADRLVFAGDPFDGADVSAEGRQIVGNEDFITDFDFGTPTTSILVNQASTTADVIAQAEAGNIYFNIHSTAFPAGEVRGQLDLSEDNRNADGVGSVTFTAVLNGENEVQDPPVVTDAEGFGEVTFTVAEDGSVSYTTTIEITDFDVDTLTVGHFHNAPAGENGPVVVDILADAGVDGSIEGANAGGDAYVINTADFGIDGDVQFAAVDANADGAAIPAGTNVIVLLNSDNDGDAGTPFLAGTAAAQIAALTETDGAGVFVYWNSNLGVNRLVYSTNLNDPAADLKILSRQTDLEGQDAIDALADFSAENFVFEGQETGQATTAETIERADTAVAAEDAELAPFDIADASDDAASIAQATPFTDGF